MKKLSLAIGIAAACAIPMTAVAGTQLYGNLKYSINSIDEDRVDGIDGLQGRDNVSLLGLKGTYGDGNVKAFLHLQTGAPSDKNASGSAFNQRFYFGGLKGNFGKVAYGRMTNAYKFPGFKLDPFYNLSGISTVGSYASGGATYGLSPATNGFTDNALQYVTPSLGGVKLTGFYIDDSNDDNHGYTIGGAWTGSGFNAGVVYASNGDTTTLPGVAAGGTATRLYGSYKGGAFVAAASYEKVDSIIAAATEAVDYFYLTGTYKAKSIKTDFKASYGSVNKGLAEGSGIVLGAFYHVTGKTQAYLTYSTADLDNLDSKPSVVSLGAIHKFSMGKQ